MFTENENSSCLAVIFMQSTLERAKISLWKLYSNRLTYGKGYLRLRITLGQIYIFIFLYFKLYAVAEGADIYIQLLFLCFNMKILC